MSNFDKAVELLNKHWSVARASGEADETVCCVQQLQEAGLLMPDLPNPTSSGWPLINRLISKVTLGTGGKVAILPRGAQFNETHIEPYEARILAYALLAAANHAEQEHQ